MADQFNLIVESLKAFWVELGSFLPQALSALLLLIVGWIFAKIIRRAVTKGLKFIHLDTIAEKAGIEDFLLQGGVRFTTVTIIGSLVYWSLMLVVMLAALNILGVRGATEVFNKIILYIPNVVVAILVLIFGSLFGKFVRGLSFTYLSNVGIAGAAVMSHLAQWAIMIFVASVALEQLAIGGQVLVSAFQIAFGALCLALALAFGLGGREWAAHILEKMWKQ